MKYIQNLILILIFLTVVQLWTTHVLAPHPTGATQDMAKVDKILGCPTYWFEITSPKTKVTTTIFGYANYSGHLDPLSIIPIIPGGPRQNFEVTFENGVIAKWRLIAPRPQRSSKIGLYASTKKVP